MRSRLFIICISLNFKHFTACPRFGINYCEVSRLVWWSFHHLILAFRCCWYCPWFGSICLWFTTAWPVLKWNENGIQNLNSVCLALYNLLSAKQCTNRGRISSPWTCQLVVLAQPTHSESQITGHCPFFRFLSGRRHLRATREQISVGVENLLSLDTHPIRSEMIQILCRSDAFWDSSRCPRVDSNEEKRYFCSNTFWVEEGTQSKRGLSTWRKPLRRVSAVDDRLEIRVIVFARFATFPHWKFGTFNEKTFQRSSLFSTNSVGIVCRETRKPAIHTISVFLHQNTRP